jgi:hypothetical protein
MERVVENTVLLDFESWHNFSPAIRSGDWSDIGGREYMEDTHVCIPNLAKSFGYKTADDEVISFYGVIAYLLYHSDSSFLKTWLCNNEMFTSVFMCN